MTTVADMEEAAVDMEEAAAAATTNVIKWTLQLAANIDLYSVELLEVKNTLMP